MNTNLPAIWPALHGGILLFALAVLPQCLPLGYWPCYALVPLAVYAAMVLPVAPLRRTMSWPSAGRLTGKSVLAAINLSVVSTFVLIAFQSLTNPDLTAVAAAVPITMLGSGILAGICFSFGNAILEELIFRSVLYDAFAAEWGAAAAILLTAVLFGMCHMTGYPSGVLGAVLAGLYGLALGLLRWWTGGLLLPTACHVTADATIFVILCQSDI